MSTPPITSPAGQEIPRPTSTLHVRVLPGDGPALVLIPGVMADAESWSTVAVSCGHESYILNRRGRAPSGPLGPDYCLETEIADVHALLDTISGPKHLFGWSYGALASLEAATGRDDLISVVAYEPVSSPFVPTAVVSIREALAAGSADRAVELVNTDVSGFSTEHVETLRSSPVWPRLCELALPLADELDAINRFIPHYDDYASIAAPVTLLVGEHNLGAIEPYGPAFSRFQSALPEAHTAVLPGLGHLGHVEDPDLLGKYLAAALTTP